MRKQVAIIYKPFLLTLFAGFAAAGIQAQGPSATESRMQNQLKGLQANYQERVYVHTDKPQYLAGEILWFKVYGMDASTHQPATLSKVVYVELLDRNGRPALQSKLALDKRGAEGSFYLPANLHTGVYLLRAYTNWMRNEKRPYFFETEVSVINTVTLTPSNEVIDSLPVVLDIYPEGGQLLQGHLSTLAFKVTGKNGRGVAATGRVLSDKGDTVTVFQTQKFGIGKFQYTPQADRKYNLQLVLENGTVVTQSLPAAADKGYLLNIEKNANGQLQARLGVNSNESLTLLVHTRNGVGQALQVPATAGAEATLTLAKEKLVPGVNYITLFNSQQQPVAERLVFVKPAASATAGISFNKQQFGKRDKVSIDVSTNGAAGKGDSVNYSLAVYQLPVDGEMDIATIQTYRWLQEDLVGVIESPGYYFSAGPGVEEATDNLMLTHGWRKFEWGKNNAAPWKHMPEVQGHLLGARVVHKITGQPVPSKLCYLSAPSVPFSFKTARTNNEGYAYFDVENYYGPGEIVVKVVSDSAINYRVDIVSPFAEDKYAGQLPLLNLQKSQENVLVQRSIAMQAQNLYYADTLRRFRLPVIQDTLPFYGKAEYTYLMDDYKRFSTVEEVLREYVYPITVTSRGGKPNMVIQDERYKRAYDMNVLVLLDGIPLADNNKMFTYDPIKLKKLDVVTRGYVLGTAVFSGIASFETYKGKFDAFDLDPSVIFIDYDGLQLRREFYSPDYSKSAGNRLPDMRTTLQWMPNQVVPVTGKSKIEFYTSDQRGRFVTVLQGLTDSGQTIVATGEFVVE